MSNDAAGNRSANFSLLGSFIAGALVLALASPGDGFAQDSSSTTDPTSPATPQTIPIGPPDPERPKQNPSWEMRPGRSYLIPALEIPAYGFLLNRFDRHFTAPTSEYRTNGDTIRMQLTDSRWVLDRDQFSVNQFLHPYGGTGLLRIGSIGRPQLLGIISLFWRRQFSLGNRRREATALYQRSDHNQLRRGHFWASHSSEWPICCWNETITASRASCGNWQLPSFPSHWF